ncbi:hypothetical protein [Flavobacterium sp.]|jgi:hypothetical protein|uniref:hypothetical protein n=1 Tax=Flavobacterium sp. TaxID=239 RepID=UPI002FDA9C9F
MSEMVEIVDSLEAKILKLINKIKVLEEKAHQLKYELQVSNQNLEKKAVELDHLQKQFETLKIANSLLGSDENKRETKLKINSLIREIDYCIAQLSD